MPGPKTESKKSPISKYQTQLKEIIEYNRIVKKDTVTMNRT